MVEIH
jgi:hypothetical protein